ncbi:hypothetical protein D3C74_370450 [compost metagenome]
MGAKPCTARGRGVRAAIFGFFYGEADYFPARIFYIIAGFKAEISYTYRFIGIISRV